MSELKRFDQKNLKQLGSHTSADQRSGEAGDIIITNTSQEAYEVLEIKFNKEIDFMMINDIFKNKRY